MKIISTRRETFQYLKEVRWHGRSVGLVPTMGGLHEGHLSLIREAVRQTEVAVVSIFVNPAQFGPNEDFDRYPRQEEQDLRLCAAEGVKVVYLPKVEDVYPEGYRTYVEVEELGQKLCGISRPQFFRGVATVVNLLFHIVHPNKAFFGLKDLQQYLILRRMVKDMGWDIEMVGLPTVREPDGLAMSSRNAYLTAEERKVAPLLYAGLTQARQAFQEGESDPAQLRQKVVERIETEHRFRIDYVEVIEPDTIDTPQKAAPGHFIALAAFLGKARLIDNIELQRE